MANEEKNKADTRRFIDEVFNQGNLAVADEFLAPDYIEHVSAPGFPPGLEGFKMFIPQLRAAFPDLHYSVEQLVAEGDTVVVYVTWTGTHKGNFLGIPPTAKPVRGQDMHWTRVKNGRTVEHWATQDTLSVMVQLGVVPPPGQNPQ